jgi:hypothetical protein
MRHNPFGRVTVMGNTDGFLPKNDYLRELLTGVEVEKVVRSMREVEGKGSIWINDYLDMLTELGQIRDHEGNVITTNKGLIIALEES